MKNFDPNKVEEIKGLEDWEIESLTIAFDRALLNGTTMKELVKISEHWSKKLKIKYRDEVSIRAHIRAREKRGIRFDQNGENIHLTFIGIYHSSVS